MSESNVFLNQSDALREVLKWLDNCPCDAIISSMAGNIVHVKVDSHTKRSKNGKHRKPDCRGLVKDDRVSNRSK